MADDTAAVTCPMCGADGQVLPLDAAAERRMSVSRMKGTYYVGPSVMGVTDDPMPIVQELVKVSLREPFVAPARPVYRSPWSAASIAAAILLASIAAGGGSIVLIRPPSTFAFRVAAAGVVTAILLLCRLVLGKRRDAAERRARTGPDAEAEWERAMEAWRKLHFCRKCEGIFFAGDHDVAPSMFSRSAAYLAGMGRPEHRRGRQFSAWSEETLRAMRLPPALRRYL